MYSPTVPEAAHVVSGDDLCQTTSVDMTNFDEAGIEEKDIRRMERYALGGTFPFN